MASCARGRQRQGRAGSRTTHLGEFRIGGRDPAMRGGSVSPCHGFVLVRTRVDAAERGSHVSAVVPAPEVVLQARTERRRHLLVLDELRVRAVACRRPRGLGE